MENQYNLSTCYFGKYRGKHPISIARGLPKWYRGPSFNPLFPTWHMITGNLSKEEYTHLYVKQILSRLNPEQILKHLDGKVMLCYEKPPEFCHRSLVAHWIEENTGMKVPELFLEQTQAAQLSLI